MKEENAVSAVWKQNERFIVKSFIEYENSTHTSLSNLMNGIFCAGPCYYYVLDFLTREIEYISPTVKQILGLDPNSVSFNDIVACVHPDDLPFIQIAEKFNFRKLTELDAETVAHSKLAYCFREKTANGEYELFQMQAVWINNTGNPEQSKLVNIHTNIHHLTTTNNYVLTLSSIKDHSFFLRYDLRKQLEVASVPKIFTKRELQIIKLIAQGHESEEIASQLCCSSHTIKTHRRNILSKAGVKNSAQLVRYCIGEGLV